MPAPYVRLGRIVRASGKGARLAVALEPGVPAEAIPGTEVWIVPPLPAGVRPFRIASVTSGPRGPLVTLEGLEDPGEAREAVGRFLLARATDVPDLREPADDLIEYQVVDEARGALGTVAEVIVTGANDVLVVEGGPLGQVLVPVIDEVIVRVDHEARVVHVRLLEGLVEEDGA